MTSAKILVTGANGFIGRTLCPALRQSGHLVRETVRNPVENNSDVIAVGNIGRETNWSAALDGIQVIIHLAARAHILSDAAADPLAEFRAVNVEGPTRLARQAVEKGVRRFIFVSSIGVLGSKSQECEALTERSTPQPASPYAIAKWEAEQALQEIRRETRLEIVIVRPPLVHGIGAPGNMERLLRWVYRGIPLPLANIDNKRSFVGVDNLADFLIRCVDSPAAANETYVISDKQDLSTPELIHLVASAMKRPARLFPMPESVARFAARLVGKTNIVDQLWGSLVVDSRKAYDELQWSPPLSAAEGIKKMAQAYLEAARE
jgi:nucleoside-diphosphate-sugar epimerase